MNRDEISKSRIFKAERMAENISKQGEGRGGGMNN
jgi:hypothetical protein